MQIIEGQLILSATDLTAFSGCRHRSRLDLLVARGELERPHRDDPFLSLLRARGERHEKAQLDVFTAAGTVVAVARPPSTLEGLRGGEHETLEAMQTGASVIYQACLFDGRFLGYADFLRRVETPSALGTWSYEVCDTKLARRAKSDAVIQLAEYSRQLARLQGMAPRELHLLLGDGSTASILYEEVAPDLERVRSECLGAALAGFGLTVPEPVAACGTCAWLDRCKAEWRAQDHLSLVAGVRNDQRLRLAEAGIATRAALAEAAPDVVVPRLQPEVLQRLRTQARLQVQSEQRDVVWELLPPDPAAPSRALAALPAPSAGDMFFDIEGDTFAAAEGLEYLLGWMAAGDRGFSYQRLWAHEPGAERASFESFIDTVMAARAADPGMHVYHYAAYEVQAAKRLATRHATREDELDELLRCGVFVDLYAVVKRSVQVGTESYSLKSLEALYAPPRTAAIRDAGSSLVEYERWLETRDSEILSRIARYNEDDCRSLIGLRDWLEERRVEVAGPRSAPVPRSPSGGARLQPRPDSLGWRALAAATIRRWRGDARGRPRAERARQGGAACATCRRPPRS